MKGRVARDVTTSPSLSTPGLMSVALPTLAIRLRWKTAQSIPSSRLSLSSGGQYSMHADFWNGWNPAVMQWLVDNCLNALRHCGANLS